MKSLILCSLVFFAAFSSVNSEAKSHKRKPAAAAAAKKTQFIDVATKLVKDDGGVTVLFKDNKGAFYLSLDTADYDRMLSLLDASSKDKKPVSVTVNDDFSNIVEVK
jgi:hypothetical protein